MVLVPHEKRIVGNFKFKLRWSFWLWSCVQNFLKLIAVSATPWIVMTLVMLHVCSCCFTVPQARRVYVILAAHHSYYGTRRLSGITLQTVGWHDSILVGSIINRNILLSKFNKSTIELANKFDGENHNWIKCRMYKTHFAQQFSTKKRGDIVI